MATPIAASVLGAERPALPGGPVSLDPGILADPAPSQAVAAAGELGHPPAAVLRSEVRAVEYRAKARDAAGRAGASVLERVRERHAQAASMWTELADSEDRRTLVLRKRFGRAANV